MTAIDIDAFVVLRARLSGSLVTRSSGYWDVARAAWVATDEHRPSAVVHAATAQDVAETLAFAAEHGLDVTRQDGEPTAARRAHPAGTILLRTCAVPTATSTPPPRSPARASSLR